ncbi:MULTISPECIES: KinB-signaling pathway activation protein [Sutcliffiella]|uniref:KinB-signaling pathway activation protein n=1 Tax=Sutcliffiella cohnii TaxID=33932 RepID=A0A223KX97_9BACI|nr:MULTISPECIES: KinB-signaling pathway activation protein [Sutcliffiella]AST94086.1 KinB-signaling pathway activation protein [Sutcliffiella cohnii]MED4018124.1 KinB-signaling pathway activation protein [Sutcliffiella cohnii]WBL15301.1 KinB-signaling pathway activation protein [Sutcliffiella sp. NC1]
MNSRNWVRLFLTTLLIGAVSTVIVGFVVRWNEHQDLFINGEILEILSVTFWFIGVGLIFSVVSQMGFFAYLTVHRFGLGIFKSYWKLVQIVLIVFVLFDLVYFRYIAFANEGESLLPYLAIPIFLLIYSLLVAYIKSGQTNKHAFVPAIFFMVVVTTVEWFPVLRANEPAWLLLMLFPLLACNSYQLLILHKINQQSVQK